MGYLFNIFYEHPLVSVVLLALAIGMTSTRSGAASIPTGTGSSGSSPASGR